MFNSMGNLINVEMINKVAIVFYFIPTWFHNRIRRSHFCRRALIIFQAHIGDCIMFLDAFPSVLKCLRNEDIKKIDVVCSRQVSELLHFSNVLDIDTEIIEADFDKIQTSFGGFRKLIRNINRRYYDISIEPQPSLMGFVISSYVNANKRIGLSGLTDLKTSTAVSFFQKYAFTDVCRVDTLNTMELNRFSEFVRWMGNSEFKSNLPYVRKQNNEPEFSEYKKYCVIAPGASKPGKEWPINNFKVIVDFIISEYDINVCICGDKNDRSKGEELIKNSPFSNKLFNFAGKTDMAEWFGLIRNAEFCISCDSASIHIAVATKTPSVCIAGRWHNFRFLPYQIEGTCDKRLLPHTVYSEVDCFGCQTYSQKKKYSEYVCPYSSDRNGVYACIEKVGVSEVKKAIDEIEKSYNKY